MNTKLRNIIKQILFENDLSNKQREVIFLIGLPASGKSTYVRELQKKGNYVIISSDNIIDDLAKELGLSYPETIKMTNKDKINQQTNEDFEKAILNDENIIIDRTNMDFEGRGHYLKRTPTYYKKIAVVFDFKGKEKEIWNRVKERAVNTGKEIPEDVFLNFIKNYQEPTKKEGFNEIVFI